MRLQDTRTRVLETARGFHSRDDTERSQKRELGPMTDLRQCWSVKGSSVPLNSEMDEEEQGSLDP